MSHTPFRALPFGALPERPRLAHDWERVSDRFVDVQVDVEAGADVDAVDVRTRYRLFPCRAAHPAPPLLLVHGLMTTGYSYRYVAHALAATRDVYVPDLPGAGRSACSAELRCTPELILSWLDGFIGELGLRGCDVVGNSMGGMLVMRHALRDPDVYRRIVSIHPPVHADLRLRALRVVGRIGFTRRIVAALPALSPLRWVHKNVHYNDESLKSLEEAEEYAAPLRTANGRAAFASHLIDLMHADGLEAFGRELEVFGDGREFVAPLLMIYADEDPMVPPEHGHILQRALPGVPFVWMKNTSHFAHVDTPEPILDELERFFR